MSKTIPAGYQIQVTSWENDADNYNTEIISGLDLQTAQFFIELGQLFAKSHHEKGGIAGNSYEEGDVKWDLLIPAFRALLDKYPGVLDTYWETDSPVAEQNEDDIRYSISEAASEVLSYGEFYFRKFDSYKAFYFPEPVAEVDLFTA